MSDQTGANDPGAIWRDQPEERRTVDLEQILKQRTDELYSSTRSEILMSILRGPALYRSNGLAARAGARPARAGWIRRRDRLGDRLPVLVSMPDPAAIRPRPDAPAASGLEYYRAELERRRDHLKNEWLWHGPLFLACVTLVAILTGRVFSGYQPLRNILPLLVLLAAWTGFTVWRRLPAGEGAAAGDRRACAARQVISASVGHRGHFPELSGVNRQGAAMVRRVLHHGPYDVADGLSAHDRSGRERPREILRTARTQKTDRVRVCRFECLSGGGERSHTPQGFCGFSKSRSNPSGRDAPSINQSIVCAVCATCCATVIMSACGRNPESASSKTLVERSKNSLLATS